MTTAEITALCTGIPAIIGAITALVMALKASKSAAVTKDIMTGHVLDQTAHKRDQQ